MNGSRLRQYIQTFYPRLTIMKRKSSHLDDLSKEHLISYIRKLESSQKKVTQSKIPVYPQPAHNRYRKQKEFDFSAYSRRKIALKFSYDGEHYNGLAAQTDDTPLPTVEEVLWGALTFTRLVDPKGGFEGCGWEKCGRTDRGVSSAGQVVSFWIRSALRQDDLPEQIHSSKAEVSAFTPETKSISEPETNTDELSGLENSFGALSTWDEPPSNTNIRSAPEKRMTSGEQELKYIGSLNNVLPPTIRIIAWSPVAPDFSARFACKYRHYKYFFTSRGLDIEAMRDGAVRLIGEHDFRNLCKLDPGKQITNFRRKILRAEINPVSGLGLSEDMDHGPGQVYVLDLVGRAFLYNQVRHIMAILFLIGTGLEKPWLMTALLNVDPSNPYPPFGSGEATPPVVPTKPLYQMADPLPLVLWDCVYADSDVSWRIDGERVGENGGKELGSNLFRQQRTMYEGGLVRAALDKHFLLAVSRHHNPPPEHFPLRVDASFVRSSTMLGIPLGGGKERRGASYVPILQRERQEPAEVLNERWRLSKGARRAGRRAEENNEDE